MTTGPGSSPACEAAAWLAGRTNIPDLAQALGLRAAREAAEVLERRLAQHGLSEAVVTEGVVQVALSRDLASRWQREGDAFVLALQEEVCREPVPLAGLAAYLHLDWHVRAGAEGFSVANPPFVRGAAVGPPERIPGYRADMTRTHRLFQDLAEQSLVLAFQPVIAWPGGHVLYHEALIRRWQGDGAPSSGGEFVAAAERIGLVARLDRAVIGAVWQVLARHPGVALGCNVSAVTLEDGAWWRCLERRLAQAPALARRLTLEITETRAIGRLDDALALLQRLRALGCRLALDDMGGGYSSTEVLMRVRPDIVKLDRAILMQAVQGTESPHVLSTLVQLCAAYARCVVVEGVESIEALAVATRAGVHGYQGYLAARPSIFQPGWASTPLRVVPWASHDAALLMA